MNYKSFQIVVVNPINIAGLGNVAFAAGTHDLGQHFTIEDIVNCQDIAQLIYTGDILSATDHLNQTVTAGVSAQATFTAFNKLGRVSQTLVEDYIDNHITIGPSSTGMLTYNNGQLDVTKLLMTSVNVDTVYTNISTWVAAEYTTSLDYQEGDVIILTAATGGTKTYIHNGGTALDITDWTLIEAPNLTDAYIRGLFSAEVNGPITYNVGTGIFDVLTDNLTLLVNSAGELYVDETTLTIATSQITNFSTNVESTIFTTSNFVDSSTIDFTVTVGDSVTASIIDSSVGEGKLNITNAAVVGYYLTYAGSDQFTWVAPDSAMIAGTAIEIATDNSINVIYDNDTIKINLSNQLYVDETTLTIATSQITNFSTNVESTIFTTSNFTDSSRIDFTVTVGDSVTADIKAGSITEDYLSIVSPSTGAAGEVLTSDGTGNFEWTPASTYTKKSWTWGAASSSNKNTNRYLDRHDGVSTNVSSYVAWFDCKLVALSLMQNGTVTYTLQVRVNGSSVATLSSGGNASAYNGSLNVSINAGDKISFYVNGTNVPVNTADALFVEA